MEEGIFKKKEMKIIKKHGLDILNIKGIGVNKSHIKSNRSGGSTCSTHSRDSSGINYIQGYSGTYLGFVPAYESAGTECIYDCVEKILDACNIRECLMRDAFADVQSSCLQIHFVDDTMKIYESKIYDLARISYCCSNHTNDTRIFSWIYRQEIEIGFQLECHAVRFSSEKKATLVASKVYEAFNNLFSEMESGMPCSSLFNKILRTRLSSVQSAEEAQVPTSKESDSSDIINSPSKKAGEVFRLITQRYITY